MIASDSVCTRVGEWVFSRHDRLFFDTNIWVYLLEHSENPPPHLLPYIDAYAAMNRAGSRLYTDMLVIGEIRHHIVDAEFAKWKIIHGKKGFKDFRKTPEFAVSARKAAGAIQIVLESCRLIRRQVLAEADVVRLTREYACGRIDFNDLVIAEICRRRRLALVTNDADFKGQGIAILTVNKALLG